MTLISTVICKYGIIQASDSHLTNQMTGKVSAGPKVFKLNFADGALALAGNYSVGHEPMDQWMPACISRYSASDSPSLAGFAGYLAAQLKSSSTADEGRLFHIAGYESDSSGVHPEFHFVRNAQSINETTGAYENFTSDYQATEDFWARDYRQAPTRWFTDGECQRYFNGFPDGRIAYLGAMKKLQDFYRQVWNDPNWNFRKPKSLDELTNFVRLELETINTLFASSDYPLPYIGGEIQIEKIPTPPGSFIL